MLIIFEDDIEIIRSIRKFCKRRDIEVFIFDSLDAFNQSDLEIANEPNVNILLDHNLQGCTGEDVYDVIFALNPNSEFWGISGEQGEQDTYLKEDRCIGKLGVVGFLKNYAEGKFNDFSENALK